MKKEYNSPGLMFVELFPHDIVARSVNSLGPDIGENSDGNAVFAD